MRIAFYSPLPPSRSGIADYSAALLECLRSVADVRTLTSAGIPERDEMPLYQVGNNGDHGFVYETALRHPGIVVLHEANLHHLVADLTIRRGDWDGYVREVEHDAGEAAAEHARRVRALEVGPDYEGVPLLRRLLERARGVICHSHFVESLIRANGFSGPVAVIPHGAWLTDGDRLAWRSQLGVDETSPLVGIFGHLKPYKRIPEALRAFRRVLRHEPTAKMILVGEPHPEFPLAALLRTLGLSAHVRVMGHTPIAEFNGTLSACDVVLNLRYPTVGETSGTLLRAFGMGKAVVVSDVGAFREYPDEICLKVPVDRTEEDFLFEYLHLLTARPDVARDLGVRARQWVAAECSWPRVARLYAEFVASVQEGQPWPPPQPERTPEPSPEAEPALEPAVETAGAGTLADHLRSWARPEPEHREYLETHLARLVKTLEMTPTGSPGQRVLEMGAYLQITPALRKRLDYGEVRGCYYGRAGVVEQREITSQQGERFECEVDLFDAERDRFPYPDEHFDTVLCCELIEHLANDPMHLMGEVNRILKPHGHLVLTTPNIASLRALSAVLQAYHPGFFPAYVLPSADGHVEARHAREYAPREIAMLLEAAGLEVVRLETGEFREEPHPEFGWVRSLLERFRLPVELRGDDIFVLGRKSGPVRERHPAWLYASGGA